MHLSELQHLIRDTYGERDRDRGVARTFAWLTEEIGEVSRAVFRGDDRARRHELADALAWLVSLADLVEVDLEEAVRDRYGAGCPKCERRPCTCPPTDGGR